MKKLIMTIGAVNVLMASSHVHALSMEQRMKAMEQRMEQLQSQLEHTQSENQQLKQKLNDITFKQGTNELKPLETKPVVKITATQPKKEDAPKEAKLTVSNTGVTFKSGDENHKVNLRGYVQADNDYFLDENPSTNADNFLIRRARLTLDGTLFKNVDFRFSPDFAGGQVRLFDAFIDLHYFNSASLMVGKFRQPVSLERMQSATNLPFIERAYPAQLAPNRDMGIMLHGAIAYPGYKAQYTPQPVFKEFLGYEVGVFNGVLDGQGLNETDKDLDNSKEIAARLFSHPFMHTDSFLKGLGIGIAGTWGQPEGGNNVFGGQLPRLISAGQQTIFRYNPTVVSIGDHYRIYPQMYWYWKSLGIMGEYYYSSQRLDNAGVFIRQNNTAWQANISYVLTGEDNTFFGIKPEHSFDPNHGHWGAWQAAFRWSELDIDDDTFPIFADPITSVSAAQSWALGLNWILNENVKIMSSYEQTHFTGGGNRPLERALFSRFQISF